MKNATRFSLPMVSLILGFTFLLHSCTVLPEITETPQTTFTQIPNPFGDGGFLSETPCGPPCFYGITPGETTKEEAKTIIKDANNLFENCVSFDNTPEGGNEGMSCNFFGFTYGQDYISSISFRPNEHIELAQVFEKIGEPDRLLPLLRSLPEDPLEGRYILCFDEPRISIWLPEIEGPKYNISSFTIIESINYVETEAYQKTACSMINESVAWEGYREYPIQIGR